MTSVGERRQNAKSELLRASIKAEEERLIRELRVELMNNEQLKERVVAAVKHTIGVITDKLIDRSLQEADEEQKTYSQNLQKVIRWLDTHLEIAAQSSFMYQTRIAVLEEDRSRQHSRLSDVDRFQAVANRCSSAIFRFQDIIDRLDKEVILGDADLLHAKQKVVEYGRCHLTALVKLNKLKQELMKNTLSKLLRDVRE